MREKTLKITATAIFTALAYATMLFIKFKVAGFLTFDVKDVVISIAAMFFGPVTGIIISVIVPLLEMFTVSDTGPYGFIMNALASLAFVLPVSVVYKYKKSIPAAVAGLSASVFSMTAIMLLANLIITPRYFGIDVDEVIKMIPKILLPFNIIKALINAGLILILLQPLSSAIKQNQALS